MSQSTTGHSHGHNPAHVGPHGHNLAVQSQPPAVVQGHVHPPATQGQQQFQRLKVHPHGKPQKLNSFCFFRPQVPKNSFYDSELPYMLT